MPNDNSSNPTDSPSAAKRAFDLIGSRLPMGSRKKSKTKIQKQDDTVESEPQAPPSTTNDPKEADGATVTPSPQAQASEDTANQDHTDPIYIPVGQPRTPVSKPRGQGWYGSWKSKAAPVTEVRRESISASPRPALNGDTPRTSQKQDFNDVNNASPHRYMSTGSIRSTKATPLAATTTNISITSGKSTENITNNGDEVPVKDIDPPLPPDPSAESAPVITSSQPSEVTGKEPPAQTASGGWLSGWWSRPDGYDESSNKKVDDEIALVDEAKNKPLPASTPSLETQDQPKDLASTAPVESTNKALENDSAGKIKIDQPTVDSKSWFWRWSATQNSQILVKLEDNPKHEAQKTDNGTNRPDTPVSQTTADAEQDSKSIRSINATIKSVKNVGGRKTSGWAFWSRESNDTTEATDPDATTKQVGELAVANTPSASHPEAAQFNSSTADEVPQEPVKPTKPAKKNTGLKKQPNQTKVVDKQVPTPVSTSPTVKVSSKAVEAATTLLRLDSHKQDILLPEFRKTYSMVQKQSMLQNLRHYFLGDGPQDHPHLHVMGNVPKVKKALAIGVHGFFPNFMVQRVLGPPTGTSIKFSNMAAGAIKSWTESQGYECEIEKVALEGEGLIADRVDTLWKLLLNWIDHVRSADFILLACHSQGVPVTIMLVDRLIKFGCISSAKIGICAMAGVNLGPFAEYRTQLFGRSALELFDFADSSSKVSISYRSALEQVLRHNVKIVFTGSLDDQLVSLESSTFSNISHPCIYRAVFIDGRFFSSDFITELVGFALKLRNLGLSDHGLIRELSPALAGSLYSGEGHSRLYDYPDVYNLAVSHALETTTPADDTPVTIRNYVGPPGSKDSNPFFLPWAMRGVLEEERVRKELSDECQHLLNLFDAWKPTTKGLKDVRFRLEALKSKL